MAKLPWLPGFRFHPTDGELICFYLKRKVCGRSIRPDIISELDIYKFAPWDLPGKSCLQSGDLEWYFYCPRDRKYANGPRMNRSTEIGYWKTTGKDRPIYNNHQLVGMKRTLVFYIGRAPHGDRTNWVIHEYRLQDKSITKETTQCLIEPCEIASANAPPIVSDIYSGLEDITTLANVGWSDNAKNFRSLDGIEEPNLYQWFDAIEEGSFLEVNDLKHPMEKGSSMLQTSTNFSYVSENSQRPLISSKLQDTTTSVEVQNILSSMLDSDLSGDVAEEYCSGTHNQIIGQAPSALSGHATEDVGDSPAWDFSRGEGHCNGDVINNLSDGGLLHSVLETLLDSFPARPASAAQYPLLPKEGKLKGNVSICNCMFASTVMNKRTGSMERCPECCYCCHVVNLKKPTKRGGREAGSGMSWRALLFVFLMSSISVLLWILLILLGLKFTRHAWKLMFAR
ncbi:unnamed protein product [Victoria cruziana]